MIERILAPSISARIGLACLSAWAMLAVAPATVLGDGLTIATAASLGPMFAEIGALYESRYADRVTLVVASSGNLARQIEYGAPFDLFASANESWVARLVRSGVIDPETTTFGLGRLVLLLDPRLPPPAAEGMAGSDGTIGKKALARLADADIRYVAIANPRHAPYGRAAKEVLQSAGLWQALESKRVYAENIRQAVQFVDSGNAEAGLAALSFVRSTRARWWLIDASLHAPLRQTLGVVQDSPNKASAKRFMAIMASEDVAAILRKFGFDPVEDDAPGVQR